MDSNSLILGRIPSNGGGICKTYEESIIRKIDYEKDHIVKFSICNGSVMREKLYINTETKDIVLESDIEENNEDLNGYKEAEILSIYPMPFSANYGTHYEYIIEVIDKESLHKHLLDERMLLEDLRTNSLSLALK